LVLRSCFQAHNPKFQFLHRDNELHAYYEFLKNSGIKHQSSYLESIERDYESDSNSLEVKSALPPPIDPIAAQIADLKERLAPNCSGQIRSPPKKVRLVMQLLIERIIKHGIWFESLVHERKDQALSFLDVNDPYYAFYAQLKQEAMSSAKLGRVFFCLLCLFTENFQKWSTSPNLPRFVRDFF
jgi:hypothetical protein